MDYAITQGIHYFGTEVPLSKRLISNDTDSTAAKNKKGRKKKRIPILNLARRLTKQSSSKAETGWKDPRLDTTLADLDRGIAIIVEHKWRHYAEKALKQSFKYAGLYDNVELKVFKTWNLLKAQGFIFSASSSWALTSGRTRRTVQKRLW